MKRVIALLVAFMLILPSMAFGQDVTVTIPEFDVEIAGQKIDNERNVYPLIVYNDITYFPMTWNFSRALGLETDWQSESGLSIGKSTESEELVQDLTANNDLSKSYTAQIAKFDIGLNGQALDNSKEEYPILIFRDITYFPLTWKFTVDEFGWESDWNQEKGLSINNTNVTNNVNINNSDNNTTDVSDINNSTVSITNNNIDNSVNNSNNIVNDYSTNINTTIDNSMNVTSSGQSTAEILAEIAKLKEMGVTQGNLTVTFVVKDEETEEGIANAVVYVNAMPVGVTDEEGSVEISVYQHAQSQIEIKHENYEPLSWLEGYTEALTITKSLKKLEEDLVEETDMNKLISNEGISEMAFDDVEFTELKAEQNTPGIINDLTATYYEDAYYIRIDFTAEAEADTVGVLDKEGDNIDFNQEEEALIQVGENVLVFRIDGLTEEMEEISFLLGEDAIVVLVSDLLSLN
ncbi:hypothetical protein EZV73_09895 [Acidaminobacter sp. JC074]|uniref:hypothetical protein n=1 Tax=Acidaminobacter sp. JC074 TaxID=2530199 RepID=UPI001F0CE64A|nr:hypothetical protein [Acidaminobacter sp. JC074]MCH4887886.1 hypothetical protein [Acidaminobacter sp. JC074]